MTARENILRAVRFERPEYIPMDFMINSACWDAYPHDEIFNLMETHKLLFPEVARPPEPFVPEHGINAYKDRPFTDDFGCVWATALDGIVGTVVGHPLADRQAFDTYTMPDPRICTGIGPIDWEAERLRMARAKADGILVRSNLRHGHTFLQLCDLRGYENLMYDFVDEDPRLVRLIGLLEEFNAYIVGQYLDMGLDLFTYPEDLGMQRGPMLSPEHFRQYIKPSYSRLMKPAREKGVIVHLHCDGDLHTLVDDLIDCGVNYINLQDLVNGIDWIAGRFAGKVCVDLDIDRQNITVMGTPAQIDALIREEVEKISRPEGGLTMVYGWYPGVPLENVKAIMDAMERYTYYWQ